MCAKGFLTYRPAGRVEERCRILAEGPPQIGDGYRVGMEKANSATPELAGIPAPRPRMVRGARPQIAGAKALS